MIKNIQKLPTNKNENIQHVSNKNKVMDDINKQRQQLKQMENYTNNQHTENT